ncbi:CDP-glycerol--glycerophosphate glycerophosphotransferase [Bhargavaea cecembensis]|uniref:CDP-glycerol--glycerophosphate glycerophosphotransferase n=1 Tax=Bhargavaea cecembensis TaxID=394098 RepID=A0A163FF95_9BACL|nr:CDP-glycerol--glycerophosphate glycerophosphotransferase [Bhargavaea cecembensis]
MALIEKLKKSSIPKRIFRVAFRLMGLLPRKKHTVFFESFHARQYSDSPRAIYEYMKKHHPEFRLVWSIDKRAVDLFESHGVPYVKRFTPKWFLEFPRAKYWVNNVRLPGWMPKPPGTIYVQTWHGTPLKKLGLDIETVHMPGTDTERYRRNFLSESSKWDFLVSPNPYSTKIFKRAFGYKGNVIESGYPRNDLLTNFTEPDVRSVRESLGIPDGKKVMLYAPTWRDHEFYEKGKYKFDFQFDLKQWEKEFSEEWVLLTRMHYLIAENFNFEEYNGAVIDVSAYPDIRDLYITSDLLITDYSSVFFDYSVLNRPIVFYMYDLDQYRDQLRGFYFPIEKEAPGPIVRTEEELFDVIRNTEQLQTEKSEVYRKFRKTFTSLEDGHATKRVVNAFLRK